MIDELEKLRQLTKTITSNGYLTDQTKAWRYAFDSVKELVCITNPSFQIKFINKPLIKKLNMEMEPLINENLAKLFTRDLFSTNGGSSIDVAEDNSISYGETYIEELGGWYERYRYYIESAAGKLIGYTFMLIDITVRKQMNDDLKNSEQELELTLDATTDGIWSWDFENEKMKFSNKYYEMLGYAPNEFEATYENWKNLIYLEDREQALAVANEFLKSKSDIYENVFRVITKSGGYLWVRSKAKVVKHDSNGKATYMIGSHENVTERKQILLALQENERLLEGVLDAIPDIIGVQDANHNILTYNKAGRDHFKLTTESMRDIKCYETLGRTFPCGDKCQTKECKKTKEPANLESYIEELGGWYDCRSYPILDDDGNVVKVIEHLRDISDIKKEQELIKEAFQRLRFLIAAMNSYIWEKQKLDDSGELTHTFADPSFCEKFYGLVGTGSEEDFEVCKRAHNKKGSELLDDFRKKDDRLHSFGDLCISTDQHCESQGKPCEYFEMGYIEHEKGSPEWIILKVRKTPIYNDMGECTGVVGFAHDCSVMAEAVQKHIEQGLEKGTIQKLDDGKTDARVYWTLERKSEGKKLNHLDFL